jgi:hypothetical protein
VKTFLLESGSDRAAGSPTKHLHKCKTKLYEELYLVLLQQHFNLQ